MLHILAGPDEYSKRQAFETIKRGLGDPAMLATNTTTLDGQTVTPEQLKVVVETVPFLADHRLVVVSGLLERFAPSAWPRGKSRADEPSPFVKALGHVPPSTTVVLLDTLDVRYSRERRQWEINTGANPLLKELAGSAELKLFPLLPKNEVNLWIQERIRQQGASISPTAVQLLSEFVGNDLWTMANEIDKLVSFAAERRIEDADVRALVSYSQETTVFALVDAVMVGRGELAQRLMKQLFMDGTAPVQLLVMLARQLQSIARARDMKSRGQSETEMMRALNIKATNSFQLRKILEQSARYSMDRLKEAYERLLETDMAIKTGRMEPELALNLLVVELCLQKSGK